MNCKQSNVISEYERIARKQLERAWKKGRMTLVGMSGVPLSKSERVRIARDFSLSEKQVLRAFPNYSRKEQHK